MDTQVQVEQYKQTQDVLIHADRTPNLLHVDHAFNIAIHPLSFFDCCNDLLP
jgi:hypothetical protein